MTDATPIEVSSYPHGTKPRNLQAAFALAALMALLPGAPAAAQDTSTAPQQPAPTTQPAPDLRPLDSIRVVESNTDLSRRLAQVSRNLNQAAPDVNIVMMDRDWFQLNLALRQIPAQPELGPDEMFLLQNFTDGSWQQVDRLLKQIDPNAAARQKLISDFVKAQTGLEVDPARFSTFTLMMDVANGQGATLPAGVGPSEGLAADKRFCTVFGEFADLDAETMTRTTAGLNGTGMNPNLDGRPLLNVLPLDVLRKTVNYHEAGHCYFHAVKGVDMPEAFGDKLKKQLSSEMYADIFAVLMLAHFDGVTNVGNTLADQRIVDNALKEPFIIRNTDPRSADYYGIFIHTTTDGLRAAQKEVDRIGRRELQRMSVNDLRQLAFRILDSVPVAGYDEAFMLTELQKHGYDATFMTKFREDNPEMGPAIDYALRIKDEMNAAIPRIIDISHLDPAKTPLEQIQFNFERQRMTREQFIQIMQQQQAQEERTVTMLKDRLITLAGGAGKANDDTLSRAFLRHKDFLRGVLENGDAAQRKAAMEYLPLMGEALSQAVIQVNGPRAVAPATQPIFEMPGEGLRIGPPTLIPPPPVVPGPQIIIR